MTHNICFRGEIRKISESSLGTFLMVKVAKFIHTENEDSDQTARMHRLI